MVNTLQHLKAISLTRSYSTLVYTIFEEDKGIPAFFFLAQKEIEVDYLMYLKTETPGVLEGSLFTQSISNQIGSRVGKCSPSRKSLLFITLEACFLWGYHFLGRRR